MVPLTAQTRAKREEGFMTNRITWRRELLKQAKFLHEGLITPEKANDIRAELASDEYSVSLHEFAQIMNLVELGQEDAARLSFVTKLSRLTYPHTPDLAPFARLWQSTFGDFVGEFAAVDEPFSPSVTAAYTATQDNPYVWPDMLKMGPDCSLLDVAEAIARERIGWDPAIKSLPAESCDACSAEASLENFTTSLGLTCPMPQRGITRQLWEEDGSWEAWLPTNPGNERPDALGQDHYLVKVTREGAPGMPGMISVGFGLGRVLLEAYVETPGDIWFNDEWMMRWNERMDAFQVAITFVEGLESRYPTEPTAEPRRLVQWSHVDSPTLGGNVTAKEYFESYNYDTLGFESIRPFTEQTWLELFILQMRTAHYPGFAEARLNRAARQAADSDSTVETPDPEEEPPDPGTTVPGLSLEEKEKFLARWSDHPNVLTWSDEEIYHAICMGM